MRKSEFTRKEVAKTLGINFNSIAKYANKKMVIPHIDNPKGSGHVRRYSIENLLEFTLIQELSNCGVVLENIKKISIILKALEYTKDLKKLRKKGITLDPKKVLKGLIGHFEGAKNWNKTLLNPEFLKKNRVYLKITDHNTPGILTKIEITDLNNNHIKAEMPKHAASTLVVDVTKLCEKVLKAINN